MKTPGREKHLTYDELLRAVVDMDDLASGRRAHLAQCPSCDQALTKINNRLTHLGDMARQAAPGASRPFRVPQRSSPFRFVLKPAWAMGMAAVLLLALFFSRSAWLNPSGGPDRTTYNAAADRQLMQEVDALVEDALPGDLQHLALLSEPQIVDVEDDPDEDLLDWIVPPIEEDEGDESIL